MLSERAAMMIKPTSGENIQYRAQVSQNCLQKFIFDKLMCYLFVRPIKLLCNEIVTIFLTKTHKFLATLCTERKALFLIVSD